MKKITILAIIFFVFSNQTNLPAMSHEEKLQFYGYVRRGNIKLINRYLKEGLDINNQGVPILYEPEHSPGLSYTQYYGPSLLVAAEAENPQCNKIFELFLNNGANPNIQNENGITALILKSKKGYIHNVRLLLHKGADPNLSSRRGLTPLTESSRYGHLNIVKLLLENGADPNLNKPIRNALKKGYVKIVRLLTRNGVNLNQDTMDKALSSAARKGYYGMTKLLLSRGANPNYNTYYNNPLIIAAKCGHTEIVNLLLNNGATQSNLNIAICEATRGGFIEIVHLLVNNGADLNKTHVGNHRYSHPIVIAAKKGNENILNLLINEGVTISDQDYFHKTATDNARRIGIIKQNETLLSWYINHNNYLMSFLKLLKSKQFIDVDIPHNLEAHKIILETRLGKQAKDIRISFNLSVACFPNLVSKIK